MKPIVAGMILGAINGTVLAVYNVDSSVPVLVSCGLIGFGVALGEYLK